MGISLINDGWPMITCDFYPMHCGLSMIINPFLNWESLLIHHWDCPCHNACHDRGWSSVISPISGCKKLMYSLHGIRFMTLGWPDTHIYNMFWPSYIRTYYVYLYIVYRYMYIRIYIYIHVYNLSKGCSSFESQCCTVTFWLSVNCEHIYDTYMPVPW